MSAIIISFLIPVYNQPDELYECISHIVSYPDDNIEIVVSDNNSTDDLEIVIKKFNDERIHWFKNTKNLGFDGNVLFGMEHCRGEFVFLLRTRDYIISDTIHDIIKAIDEHPNVAYISGSCLDDDGLPRRFYTESLHRMGEEAFSAHDMLPFHPSGNCYRKKLLDIDMLRHYYDSFAEPKVWFLVDQLIRTLLAQKGDFFILGKPIWIYTYTNRCTKTSVHNAPQKGDIYDSYYNCLRYESELEFIKNEVEDTYRKKRLYNCFSFWLLQTTWCYHGMVTDKNLQEHYGFSDKSVSVDKERNDFLIFSRKIEHKYYDEVGEFEAYKKNAIQHNIEIGRILVESNQRKQYVEERSQEVIRIVEENKKNNVSLDELINNNGHNTIGLYGMGYLGKYIWNQLRNSSRIKVKYICDKLYPSKAYLGNDTWAIPPKDIHDYEVDICLVTPIHVFNEIVDEIRDDKTNYVSMLGYLEECQAH